MKRGIVALIFIVVFVLVVATTYLLISSCLSAGTCVVDADGNQKISPIDAFGYAGVLVTVLAFVAAFAIVLMTIDALAISTTVRNNSEQVSKNLAELESLQEGTKEAEEKLGSIQIYLRVLEKFSDELNRSSELDDDVYFVLEVMEEKIGTSQRIKEKILQSRQLSRHRRTRLNALRELSLHLSGQGSDQGVSQVYPELISAFRNGDEYTKDILVLLEDNGLLSDTQKRTFEGVVKQVNASKG